MTSVFDSVGASVFLGKEHRAQARDQARKELALMSEAMIAEEGLLNHAQAALLLGVSVKRIGELTRLGKLKRFDFMGRTYVSVREVQQRDQDELKAGRRAKRSIPERLAGTVKTVLKTDAAQLKLGGFNGPYFKEQERKSREKRRSKKP